MDRLSGEREVNARPRRVRLGHGQGARAHTDLDPRLGHSARDRAVHPGDAAHRGVLRRGGTGVLRAGGVEPARHLDCRGMVDEQRRRHDD